MTDQNKTARLLADFYNGDTTPEEEKYLAHFFNNHKISEKWRIDRDLFHALYNPVPISLPEGLSERLEIAINRHIGKTSTKSYSKLRKLYISLLSAAAVALLCTGIFLAVDRPSGKDFIVDTYTNPEEAGIAAEKALLFVSAKLNEGLAPLEKVKESVHKTTQIINANLK